VDYYEVLQVSPNAEFEVIQAAYRRLSMKYHPDRNYASSECNQKMRSLNAAYGVLSNPARRAEYDRTFRRSSACNEGISFTCPHCHNTVSQTTGLDGDICLCPVCHRKVRLCKKRAQKPAQDTPQERVDEGWKNVVKDSPKSSDTHSSFTKQALRNLREKHKKLRKAGNGVAYAGIPVVMLLLLLTLVFPAGSFLQSTFAVLFLFGIPVVYLTRLIVMRVVDERMEPVKLNYRFNDRTSEEYGRLIQALNVLSDAHVWTLSESQNGGYVRSSKVLFGVKTPKLLKSNVNPACLLIGTDKYWFFPDCVVSFEGGEYYASRFSKLSLDLDDATVYDGQEVIGYRWHHSRVDGGPDRRFRTNYQIPTYRDVFNTYRALVLNIGGDNTILIANKKSGDKGFESLASQYQRYSALIT